jgi:hypothetical protein
MYKYNPIPVLIASTEAAIKKPIERLGVVVYVECNPDDVGPDIYIDPTDKAGITIFHDFLAKINEHYKSLVP